MALPAELQKRLTAARNDRARHQPQINEFLRLADPVRPRIGDGGTTTRADEAADLYDPIMQEVAEDFASDILHRAMPRDADWVKYEPESVLPQEMQKALAEPLKGRTEMLFSAIRQSNFYSEAGSEWALDLGHGTGAMIANDYGGGEPLCFEGIGPHQLLIERGAKGQLSLKAREFSLPREETLAQWMNANWPAQLIAKAKDNKTKRQPVVCIEAATRLYDQNDEAWLWQVCVDGHVIYEETLVGVGSCPIIVTRWRSISTTAWGVGPLRKALANGTALDQIGYLRMKHIGRQVDPVTVYDDDGVLNPEGGVGAGMWLPRIPGSRIDQLDGGKIEVAYYEQGQLQDSIRRAGFQAGPRQEGKTPPTFGQWMDQRNEQGRRLEQPTGKLYEEGVIAILNRVEYLLVQRGEIEPMVQVDKKLVRVRAMNPLAKQQDGEKVTNASNLLTMARGIFGDQAIAASVDTVTTIENLKRAMDDDLIAMRPPEQADEMMRGVLGQPGMAPGLETAPAGAPA